MRKAPQQLIYILHRKCVLALWFKACTSRARRGGSPPTPCQGPGQAKDARCTEAKKFWSRLRFDPNLNASDFTVGFAESREEHERRSGKVWNALPSQTNESRGRGGRACTCAF